MSIDFPTEYSTTRILKYLFYLLLAFLLPTTTIRAKETSTDCVSFGVRSVQYIEILPANLPLPLVEIALILGKLEPSFRTATLLR